MSNFLQQSEQTSRSDLPRCIGQLRGTASDEEKLAELAPDAAAWQRLFEDIPLDRMSFVSKFGVPREELRTRLESYWRDARHDTVMRGYLGLLLLTLLLLEESERRRAAGPELAEHLPDPGSLQRLCNDLVTNRLVRQALEELYRPPDLDGETSPEQSAWRDINFDSLTFHELGTTSFILRGREKIEDDRTPDELALKCVLYPYTKIPAIAKATRDYRTSFGVQGANHLISVWASTDMWVLMDFVDGRTLDKALRDELAETPEGRPGWHRHLPGWLVHRLAARPTRQPRRWIRADLLAKLAPPLLDALEELEGQGIIHQDLSPRNIIIRADGGGSKAVLIDLGRNHLYTRSIGALEGPDAIYVAPEVKKGALLT